VDTSKQLNGYLHDHNTTVRRYHITDAWHTFKHLSQLYSLRVHTYNRKISLTPTGFVYLTYFIDINLNTYSKQIQHN